MKKHFKFLLAITLPLFAVLLTFDLVSKWLIERSIALGSAKEFMPGFIEFLTVHNYGAAWGMFDGSQIFLIVLSFVFLAGLVWYMAVERTKNPLFHVAMGFVLAGTIGNLVDRLAFGYVRDFLHFEFWPSFPVFNIADVCLTVGVVLFVIYIIIFLVKSIKKKEKNFGKEN